MGAIEPVGSMKAGLLGAIDCSVVSWTPADSIHVKMNLRRHIETYALAQLGECRAGD